MALKLFNSVHGFSVGLDHDNVIDAEGNVTANNLTVINNTTFANITATNFTANAGVFTGNGSGLTAISGANISGQVGNALVAGTVYTNAQPNITSVGNLTGLTVVGEINGTGNTNASSAVQLKFNKLGSLANATLQVGSSTLSYTPTIDTAFVAAGNFEGTFSGITIQNRNSSSTSSTNFYLSADNATETTNYVAYGINGSTYDGGQLMDTAPYSTYLTSTHGDIIFAPQALRGMGNANSTGGNIHFTYNYINDDTYISKAISITNKGALSVNTVANAGNYTFSTGTSGQILVSGGPNSALSWSNTAPFATTAGTVTTAAQPNITSVGTLSTLSVSGNISGGNLTVTTVTANSILQLGTSNAAPNSPQTGMFAVADRVNWDPAAKGSGNPYPVFYDGTAWNALY